MEQIHFKDLEALKEKISQEFGSWGKEFLVTQELIDLCAKAFDDYQPMHVDPVWAKEKFGGTVAHGCLILGRMHMLAPQPGFKIGGYATIIKVSESAEYKRPILAGNSVHARSRLIAAEEKHGGTLITIEVRVFVVGSDKLAMVVHLQVLYR